ncbi:MAG: hypothetical protein K2K48_02250 [Anaeroplasmataceae bacterium]|nr:hypothetical protein [Anaeroplasmataceae bacterium]
MNKEIKQILKQELTWAYIGLVVCFVFTAVSVGLIIIWVDGSPFPMSAMIFICIILFLLLGFSVFLFIQCMKRLIPYYQSLKALKYGIEDTATICDYSSMSIKHGQRGDLGWNYNTFYSLKLKFYINGKEVLYKTAHNYNQEQFNQLYKKPEIKIKRYKNTAVIMEEFYDELAYDFSELPKNLRINSILVVILAWISLALIVAGIACLCIFEYTPWGMGIFISGIVLIIISAILKSFIIYATEKFVKKTLPYIRKAQKRNRWKEKEENKKL